ncbi:Hypothetical protein SMAX5B_020495 [Scophthalmus maximus]|uniref:Uncharacterized protein n=1 Tax=Scophthalmus maximus TaxID=52904 RepID=A0A2U9C2H5_SCOMX|nr:Hypothetical protein SMAX5B_020495 [Scophthalmus maximus]
MSKPNSSGRHRAISGPRVRHLDRETGDVISRTPACYLPPCFLVRGRETCLVQDADRTQK